MKCCDFCALFGWQKWNKCFDVFVIKVWLIYLDQNFVQDQIFVLRTKILSRSVFIPTGVQIFVTKFHPVQILVPLWLLLVQGLLCWSTSAGRPFWCFGWQQWQLWAGKWRVDQSSKLLGNFFSNGEFDGKLVQNSCQIVLIWYRISWTFWYFYLVWWIGALILYQNCLHGHPIILSNPIFTT